MNYTEFREGSRLLEEIERINWTIESIEREKYIPMTCFGYKVLLFDEQTEKVLEILKEIRDGMVKRSEELGVTED